MNSKRKATPGAKGILVENQKPAPKMSPPRANVASLLPTHLGWPQGGLRLFSYLLALLPPCGFILGIIYYSQPQVEAKQYGKHCFLLASLGLIIYGLYWVMLIILGGLRGAGSAGLVENYF